MMDELLDEIDVIEAAYEAMGLDPEDRYDFDSEYAWDLNDRE